MKKHVSTLVIGASCRGCGIASVRPDSLILERTNQPGSEFTLTGMPIKIAQDPSSLFRSAAASRFQEELLRRKAIVNGRLHHAALTPILCKWILEHRLDLRLNAPIVRQTGNQVQYMNAQGLQTCEADEIIDARPVPGKEKYLYSVLSDAGPGTFDSIEIGETISPDRFFLRYPFPLETTYDESRRNLIEWWNHRPGALRTARLLWSAAEFSFDTVRNPAEELDRGMERGAR